jgi:hypothetical protein
MYLIRDVFTTKPGRAKDLVAKFKEASPHMKALGGHSLRVMTDTVAGYWTVVMETEVEELEAYFAHLRDRTSHPEIEKAMSGYMELVVGGHREIFRIE